MTSKRNNRFIAPLSAALLGLALVGCGSAEDAVTVAPSAEDSTEDGTSVFELPWTELDTEGADVYDSEEWLGRLAALTLIRIDRNSYSPAGILESLPQGSTDIIPLTGTVAGAPTFEASELPIEEAPEGLDPAETPSSDTRYMVILRIPVETDNGLRTVAIQMGVQRNPDGDRLLLEHAPRIGTRILAVGEPFEDGVLSVAGIGISLEESDGSAAIGYTASLETDQDSRASRPTFDSVLADTEAVSTNA